MSQVSNKEKLLDSKIWHGGCHVEFIVQMLAYSRFDNKHSLEVAVIDPKTCVK